MSWPIVNNNEVSVRWRTGEIGEMLGARGATGQVKVELRYMYPPLIWPPTCPPWQRGRSVRRARSSEPGSSGPFPNHAGFLQTHAHARTTLNGVECCRRRLEDGRLSGARRCIIHDTLLSRMGRCTNAGIKVCGRVGIAADRMGGMGGSGQVQRTGVACHQQMFRVFRVFRVHC